MGYSGLLEVSGSGEKGDIMAPVGREGDESFSSWHGVAATDTAWKSGTASIVNESKQFTDTFKSAASC